MRSIRSGRIGSRPFPSWHNAARRPRTVLPRVRLDSWSPATYRAWSPCDAVQNFGPLSLPESAVSSFVAMLIVIDAYKAALPQPVHLISAAVGAIWRESKLPCFFLGTFEALI